MTGKELSTLAIILQYILGITLVVAGIGKFQNLSTFVQGVLSYQVLPAPLARWYGRLLPVVEIGTGAFFLAGLSVRSAAVASMLMFSSFALAVAISLLRRRTMPCYCFGADASDKMGWHTLARILLLLLASAIVAFGPSVSASENPMRVHSFNDLADLIPIAMLTAFGLIVLSLVGLLPWVIRAWTAPAIQPNRQRATVFWAREPEPPREEVQTP